MQIKSKDIELSIIVPVYNVEEYLRKCVDSILAQTLQSFELILVDDGSTDNSGKVCDEYKEKDSRVTVIHKSNGGLISAKIAGLKIAVGKYIGFVDGDDWIDDNMYEVMCQAAISNHADIVIVDNDMWVGNRIIKINQGINGGMYNKQKLIADIYPNLAFMGHIYCLGVSPSLCTKIIKRELLLKYQPLVDRQIKGGEDAACSFPCILQADSLYYVKNFYPYHYRVHKKSMTHSKKRLEIEERLSLIKHMSEIAGRFEYEGIKRQVILYSIMVIEELILNAIECEGYIANRYLNEVIQKIRNCCLWGDIASAVQCNNEYMPRQTLTTLRYVMLHKKCDRLYLDFCVFKLRCKQEIKKILYNE